MIIINKATSCGYSSSSPMFSNENEFQFLHTVVLVNKVFFDYDFSVVISKVALVDVPKECLRKADKLRHIPIFGDRLSDIIDLSSNIVICGVRKEDDAINFIDLWRDVDNFPFWRLPDAMKLCFNHNALPNMDTPANHLLTTICRNMLWDNGKTFIDWFSTNRAQWDKGGIFT